MLLMSDWFRNRKTISCLIHAYCACRFQKMNFTGIVANCLFCILQWLKKVSWSNHVFFIWLHKTGLKCCKSKMKHSFLSFQAFVMNKKLSSLSLEVCCSIKGISCQIVRLLQRLWHTIFLILSHYRSAQHLLWGHILTLFQDMTAGTVASLPLSLETIHLVVFAVIWTTWERNWRIKLMTKGHPHSALLVEKRSLAQQRKFSVIKESQCYITGQD